MSIAQSLLPEFDQEMASTRKVLERVPDDKFDWKTHPKSNTMGWVASHLANIPSWVPLTFDLEELDINPVGGPPYRSPAAKNTQEVLEIFDRNVAAARKSLAAAADEQFGLPWTLASGGHKVFTIPKSAVIRSFVISHIIHHRAHLCVYLRLNDIPVPGLYGPSADEM